MIWKKPQDQKTAVRSSQPEMSGPPPSSRYYELKERIHQRVIELMDMAVVATLDAARLRTELTQLIEQVMAQESVLLNAREREQLIAEVQHEVLGYGPLEPLLQDPSISDVLINTAGRVYIERKGKLELTQVRFRDDTHLRKIIDKIVSAVGRRVDESSPMVDARLPDGSRVNAIIPPLAVDGSVVSIRRFSRELLRLRDLEEKRSLTPEMGELLRGIVLARKNVLISGGTGSGKTTLLNILSEFIPSSERIITIEDSAELQLQQDHLVRLETRPPNIEGKGEVTQRDLLRNSLRMRPDRIILGEVRGPEALDMLQAMNTGHDGSLTTIHASGARDALTRVETMVAMTGLNLPTKALRHYISSALNVIIQVARLSDGSRKLTSLQEITGMEQDVISLQEIFLYEQTGVDEMGRVHGRFRATGVRPRFVEAFKTLGIHLSPNLFDPFQVYDI
jgi:pilus assembly protein CpaF